MFSSDSSQYDSDMPFLKNISYVNMSDSDSSQNSVTPFSSANSSDTDEEDTKKNVLTKSFGLTDCLAKEFVELLSRTNITHKNDKIVGVTFDNVPVMVRRKGGGISISKSAGNRRCVLEFLGIVNKVRKYQRLSLFSLIDISDKLGLSNSYDSMI